MRKVKKIKKVKKINIFLSVLCLLLIIAFILLHQLGKKSTLLLQQPELSAPVVTESKVELPLPPPQPIKNKILSVEEKPQPKEDLNYLKDKGKKPFIPF